MKIEGLDKRARDLALLSIVIPDSNEAEQIEAALIPLLEQDYSYLEIIAINDRSTGEAGGDT